jgi:hydrogenase maturation protein HypF
MTRRNSPSMNACTPTAPADTIARQAEISGIVQGVGFRPYVYRLAHDHGLRGQVTNTASGVRLWVEGPPEKVAAFFDELPRLKPPLAHIVAMDVRPRPVAGHADFVIVQSRDADFRDTLISPDVAVCDDCLRELFDPGDRRFGYPFINCTNCGPRYTIIEDIPYDRPRTAMRGFTMCAQCQAEYDDPGDRRFHAQPNACAVCGPRVTLHDSRGDLLQDRDPIARTAGLIQSGHIVAVKGLGGFHLAVDATNDDAVRRLRARKHREEKPLAVMSLDVDTIAGYAHVTQAEAYLLASIQRPIVLAPKRLPERLAFSVAPRNHYYGVMLPYTPLHYLLLAHGFTALVMTSANLSEEPIAIDNSEAFERLGPIADYYLAHDRPIYLRSDDSVVRRAAGQTRLLRRSRGFVPVPVFLRSALPMVLACGAELKSTVCLTKGKRAFVSQHIGDLDNPATESFFRMTIDHLKRILDIAPEALACDLHPGYLSTQWAEGQPSPPLVQVQHHHAHVAACMAEHQLEGQVLGLAFDGTGYGPDGTVWGGEALAADLAGYERLAHLAYAPMPGSAAAIREPWRMGLAYLEQTFGEAFWDLDLPFLRDLDRGRAKVVGQMIAQRINTPLTSSLGRLFDGVAAIVGLRQTVAFEGQAAMELEMIADGETHGCYDAHWEPAPVKQVPTAPIISGIVEDIRKGTPAFVISRKFHDSLIALWTDLCTQIRAETDLERVVLSGGCFQNRLLLEGLTRALQQAAFEVYSHQLVPTNDGGISLGQAVVAGTRIMRPHGH